MVTDDARDSADVYRILPLEREHLHGFHAALDAVAREGRHLAMLQAPPFVRTRRFVLDSLKDGAVTTRRPSRSSGTSASRSRDIAASTCDCTASTATPC